MEIDKKIIKAMPKTDLHVHLDGSVRIATLLELAKKQNVNYLLHIPRDLKKILVPGLNCKSLDDYLRPFDIVLSVLQDEEALIALLLNWPKMRRRKMSGIWKFATPLFCIQKKV